MRLPLRTFLGLAMLLVLTGAMAMAQSNNVFTCSSDDGRLHSCRVNTNQPIQFVRQRSDAQCIAGQTYGIDRGGVWVTNGCRADFAVVNGDQAYNQGTYNNDGSYNQGTYNRGNNQGAYNDRDHDRDHDGYRDANGNWHRRHRRGDRDGDNNNNGTYSQNGPYNNGTYNTNDPYNNGTYNQQGTYQGPNNGGYVGSGQNIKYYGTFSNGVSTCAARDDQQVTYCSTYGALSNATVLQQNGRCVRGQTWDINRDGLWVAGNCSGKFQVQR
jgi:hypothetical protein